MVGSFGFDYSFYLFSFVYKQDVPLVELIYPVFTRMPGERYCRPHRPLLCQCVMSIEGYLTPLCVLLLFIFFGLFVVVVSFSLFFFFFLLFSFFFVFLCLVGSMFV